MFSELQVSHRDNGVWTKLWIECAGFVCSFENYSQEFSPLLNFSIAAATKFFHSNAGTRKRRIGRLLGSSE